MTFQPAIKWSGSKRSQAEEIVKRIPNKRYSTYYEPFCGGCSILFQVLKTKNIFDRYVCGDMNGDLISLWNKIRESPSEVIQNWLRNRSTVEFLGLWERIHSPDFNYLEFEVIESDAGRNAFVLTPKRWIESVGAIGMVSKQGRWQDGVRGSSSARPVFA